MSRSWSSSTATAEPSSTRGRRPSAARGIVARSLKKELWSSPNIITLVRIGAIPVFLVFTYYESREHSFIAALVYSATSATDFLDGWLARRMNLVTVIGKFLDPLADKLIAMSALVMMVHLGRVTAWIVIVVMAREFAVTGLRTIAMSEGIVIAAGQEGKYKTALQLVAIVFLLLHYAYPIEDRKSTRLNSSHVEISY